MSDPIVAAVRADLLARSQFGIAKYGVTLDRTDIALKDWLQLAYEEALDHALYLKRAMGEVADSDASHRAGWEACQTRQQAVLRQHGFMDAAGLVAQMAAPAGEPDGMSYRGG